MGILSTIKNRVLLENFVDRFPASRLPIYRDLNSYGELYKVDVYDKKPEYGFMHESVCSGISTCEFEAYQIALSEYFERKAINYNNLKYSNGCAAQPIYFSRNRSLKVATQRGRNEAFERFAFYKWFEDPTIKHNWIKHSNLLSRVSSLVRFKRSIGQIKIHIDYRGFLILSYIELGNGLLFGVALDQQLAKAQLRSESELFRNSISFINSNNKKSISQSDLRIKEIARHGKRFLNRIETPGSRQVKFPSTGKIYELKHEWPENIIVIRFTFEDTIYDKRALRDNRQKTFKK